MKPQESRSVAAAYLALLADRGVEYLFGNAGTDFAPLIEAYAKRGAQGQAIPRPITVPHEVPAVAMAHGYAMVTGRVQAVLQAIASGQTQPGGLAVGWSRPCYPGRGQAKRRAQPGPDAVGHRG